MAKLCISLTGNTIARNLEVLERYRNLVDMAELRVDYLDPEEQFYVRLFPEKAGMPVMLTVRRFADGGKFLQGEAVRLVIIAKALAFADQDRRKNFAYVDIEHDLQVPSIQEAARTFGTRIIRSYHCNKGFPENIDSIWRDISSSPYEIPKLSVMVNGIAETDKLIRFFSARPKGEDRIVVGMGDYGFCTRVLTQLTGSMLSYSSAVNAGLSPTGAGQIDAEALSDIYRVKEIDSAWKLYGILGGPAVINSLSPSIHNAAFAANGMRSVYVPFPADDMDAFMRLADLLNLQGFSVTVPFKERILTQLETMSSEVKKIGACNTLVRTPTGWAGHNTDAYGFRKALLEFLGVTKLDGMRASIIGAGGAAKAVACVLHEFGVNACVINRNMNKAKHLAETYGFQWSGVTERAVHLVEKHNDLIIQTTPIGMTGGTPGDPLEWYELHGTEAIFETIYNPTRTPLLVRAEAAGCRTTNGMGMLRGQASAQFSLFTGLEHPDNLDT